MSCGLPPPPPPRLFQVWSAPNYFYRCGNVASMLTIRRGEDLLRPLREMERTKKENRALFTTYRESPNKDMSFKPEEIDYFL